MPIRHRRLALPRLVIPRPVWRYALLLAMALSALAPLTAVRAADTATGADTADSPFTWFDPIIEAHRLIRDRFVTKPDMPALQRAALDAMIEELGDPYTVFVPNENLGDFNKSLRGEYVGIGATVRVDDGWMTIV